MTPLAAAHPSHPPFDHQGPTPSTKGRRTDTAINGGNRTTSSRRANLRRFDVGSPDPLIPVSFQPAAAQARRADTDPTPSKTVSIRSPDESGNWRVNDPVITRSPA